MSDCWIAQCQDCPTVRNTDYGYDQKAEWAFPVDRHGEAVKFAGRHQSLQGHIVTVLRQVTVTFDVTELNTPLLDYLLGRGDSGDVERSLHG